MTKCFYYQLYSITCSIANKLPTEKIKIKCNYLIVKESFNFNWPPWALDIKLEFERKK